MPCRTARLTELDVAAYIQRQCEADGGRSALGLELEWIARPANDPVAATPIHAVERVAATAPPLPAGGSVTFEPGGQLELSTCAFTEVDLAVSAATADIGAVRYAAAAHGLELLASGTDPLREPSRLLDVPRYRSMEQYFDRFGPDGRRMMCSTAALQVNIGCGPPHQWTRRFRLAEAVGPVLVAAFANSPLSAGRRTGWRSTRMATWLSLDRTRCAAVGGDDDLVSAWTRYALAAEVMAIRDGDGLHVLDRDFPFNRWMREGHPLGFPTEDDLAYHVTTLFPPVRVKGWFELRMIDALPSPYWEAAAAVVYALLVTCDPDAVRDAIDTTVGRWQDAARYGLEHPAMAAAAAAVFDLAEDAVPSALTDAVSAFRSRFVDRRRCPADDQLDAVRVPAWH